MSRRLEGRTIIVTGAGSGIGACFAAGFAAEGASVGVLDRDLEPAQQVASDIAEAGGSCIAVPADVTDQLAVRDAFSTVRDSFGRLDAVFNNAGITFNSPFLETSAEDFRRLHEVNVLGVVIGMQEAARIFMQDGRSGKIVNTCSVASRRANANFAAYAASKFAVHALVQSGARSLAEHRITVNGFAPGIVDTALWDAQASTRAARSALFDKYGETIPIGRTAVPADLLPTGIYLAGNDSDYMTGQVVMIDGGIEMV
ncbi:SDR family oxidoreductase [Arthrobacter sp. I2-34]|uniref:SDR family oxidoreductase n=1 Tax=Arthrobacter hankyongi TaxID=2904801 RepID=A0ABS9L8Q2_9MICC|nr:SDR family NAD(P)-dependent oxidoreductase [Arthrobacter hankyongi]MCG2623056.1 SDR family oxidoreductase [Arthrobacter hankyongi]